MRIHSTIFVPMMLIVGANTSKHWLLVKIHQVPTPLPGSCQEGFRGLVQRVFAQQVLARSHPEQEQILQRLDLGTVLEDRLQWNVHCSDCDQSCCDGFQQRKSVLMDKIGVEAGPLCIAHLASRDRAHSRAASYVMSERRRKSKSRWKKGTEEAHVDEEGVTYEPAGFFDI